MFRQQVGKWKWKSRAHTMSACNLIWCYIVDDDDNKTESKSSLLTSLYEKRDLRWNQILFLTLVSFNVCDNGNEMRW